jgi:quinol monooxygenase YgiN
MAYVVAAQWRAKECSENRLAALIDELIEPSRAEPACLLYQAHMDSEHFTRLVKQEAIPHVLESRERAFYLTFG